MCVCVCVCVCVCATAIVIDANDFDGFIFNMLLYRSCGEVPILSLKLALIVQLKILVSCLGGLEL